MHKEKEHKVAIDENSSACENFELVHSGEDYFTRLLQLISNAQTEIHFQTYSFDNDETGLEIARALKEARKRNVNVYVLLDGYGSAKLPSDFFEDLESEGIHIRLFSTWYSKNNFYIGRRLHHKVVVVDGKSVLIGGINIGNKYRGTSSEKAWLDYALLIKDKAIALELEQLCKNIYLKKKLSKRKAIQSELEKQNESVKILRNDWLKNRKEIYSAYINAFRKAEQELIIVGSYFLPGRKLSRELKKAAKRGVKVKIILSGVTDLPMVMRATQYLYASLLNQSIEIFEWKKSILHGKIMLMDKNWSTIGSFNLNHLSSYGSIEMNAEINSEKFSEKFYTHLMDIVQQSEKITVEKFNFRNNPFTKFKSWFAYQIVRLALIIATYIPYKRIFKWEN